MFWRRKKLTYEISIPPIVKPFDQMSKKDAQEYFDWYKSTMQERIAYLGTVSKVDLDYSPASLRRLWAWFLRRGEVEITPKEKLANLEEQLRAANSPFVKEVLADNEKQLTLETEIIVQDIARYFGEVFIKNNPSLYWGYYSRPKNDAFVNQPVLMGMPNRVFPEKAGVPLPVIHMVRVRALRLIKGNSSSNDLYELYEMNKT